MRDKTSSIKISTLVYGRQGDLYSAVSIAGLHLCNCHHRTITQALACREARAVLESRKKQHLLKRLGDDLYYRRYRDAIKVTEEYMI